MMSKNIRKLLLAAVYTSFASSVLAQNALFAVNVPPEATAAAASSIRTLHSISAEPTHALALGLDAPGQALQATVGDPVVDYIIGLNTLREWNGEDPHKLLRQSGQFVYPIAIGGLTKSSVTIAQIRGDWVPAQFGAPNEAKVRSDIGAKLRGPGPGGASHAVQVRIPALRLTLMASQDSGQMYFTSLTSRPDLGIELGKSEPAGQLLKRLQPFAKRIDPNVPN